MSVHLIIQVYFAQWVTMIIAKILCQKVFFDSLIVLSYSKNDVMVPTILLVDAFKRSKKIGMDRFVYSRVHGKGKDERGKGFFFYRRRPCAFVPHTPNKLRLYVLYASSRESLVMPALSLSAACDMSTRFSSLRVFCA